jgi:hypothetical protein
MTSKSIKLVEYYSDHWYKVKIDGYDRYFPSVTTKLGIVAKPFLATWRGDIGNREADMRMFEAAERGTRIHHAWYTMTTGGAVLYQPPMKPIHTEAEIEKMREDYNNNICFIKYQDEMRQVLKLKLWNDAVKPQYIASELSVFSQKYREAGTVDNIMLLMEGAYKINGAKPLDLPRGKYIVDLKTGKSVDDNAYMQVAAYAHAYEEMGGGEITGCLILHTSSKNKSGIEGLSTLYRSRSMMREDFADYRHAAALWERKNKDLKPTIFELPSIIKI